MSKTLKLCFCHTNDDGSRSYEEILLHMHEPIDSNVRNRLSNRISALRRSGDNLNLNHIAKIACDEIIGENAWEIIPLSEIDFDA